MSYPSLHFLAASRRVAVERAALDSALGRVLLINFAFEGEASYLSGGSAH